MESTPIIGTLVPIAIVVAIGFWLGGREIIPRDGLARLVLTVSSPALVFVLFHELDWAAGSWVVLIGAVAWTLVVTGTSTFVLGRWFFPGARRGVLLAAMFWNAGNLGLSVNGLAFGAEGLAAAGVIFPTVTTSLAIFGTWIARGRGGGREALTMPLVWGCIAGTVTGAADVHVPKPVLEPLRMLAATTIPLMLLTLGMQLRRLRISSIRFAIWAVAIRMVGGAVAMASYVAIFGVDGVERKVLTTEAVLPAAVIGVVFAQRYDADPDVVASAIVLGTIVSAVMLPFALAIAQG